MGKNKWSVILANPPYDNGLGNKFLEKFIDLSNIICTVQPSDWLIGKRQNKRITSKINDCEVIVSKIDASKIFNVTRLETEVSVCYINLLNKKCIKYNGISVDNIENVRFYSHDKYLIELEKIINPIVNKDNVNNHICCIWKNDKNIDYNEYYVLRIPLFVYGYKLFGNHDDIKIGKFKDIKSITTSKGSTKGDTLYLKMFLAFKTYNETKNAYNYLRTDFVNSCLSLIKSNMHTDRGELKYIPWFDFSDPVFSKSPKEIDDYLFAKFNISNEIRKHIEEILPDYYGIR